MQTDQKKSNQTQKEPIEFGCVISFSLVNDPAVIRSGHVVLINPHKENAVLWISTDSQFRMVRINADYEIDDVDIQQYSISAYPSEPGYARQTGLVPGQWVSIQLKDDPAQYIGEIKELQEDMITVQLQTPKRMTVFFDFEYRGLYEELGIRSFTKIQNPALEPTLSDNEAQREQLREEVDEDVLFNEDGEPTQYVRAAEPGRSLNNMGDDSEIAAAADDESDEVEELGEDANIMMDVEVRDSQKQYDLKYQLTEMVDKLYANYGTREITPFIHARIAKIIEQFTISHQMFTQYDKRGNAVGFKQSYRDFRPFYEQFQTMTDVNRCSFVIPISTIRKKMFDDGEVDDDLVDWTTMTIVEKEDQDPYMYVIPNTFFSSQDKKLAVNAVSFQENNELKEHRLPFMHVNAIKSQHTGSTPLQTLVRNNDNGTWIPPTLFLVEHDDVINPVAAPQHTQVYLPGEPMHIHSLYKVPKKRPYHDTNKSRYLMDTTPIYKKTVQQLDPHYSALWKIPHSTKHKLSPDRVIMTRGDPAASAVLQMPEEAFLTLPAIVHEIASRFRHCTTYYDTLKILEEYATRPENVDRNTAVQLIDHVHENIRAYKQQHKKHYDYLYQTTQHWAAQQKNNKPVESFSVLNEDAAKEELIQSYYDVNKKDPDNLMKQRHAAVHSSELFCKAMDKDAATLIALYIRQKNAKLYKEEKLVPANHPNHVGQLGLLENENENAVLAKQYEFKEELEKDNGSVIYFDRVYDTTPYSLLTQYKKERAKMTPAQFKEFFQETLFQVHGVSEPLSKLYASWIIDGKRPVEEGHYAKLIPGAQTKEKESPVFYRRTVTQSWERDDDISAAAFASIGELVEQTTSTAAAAAAASADYRLTSAADQQSAVANQEIEQRMRTMSENVNQSIGAQIQAQTRRIQASEFYKNRRDYRHLVAQYAIGQLPLPPDNTANLSPYLPILDKIREYSGSTKDTLIIQFYKQYCTDSSILYLPTERLTRYWKYCKDTGTPLLPTSEYELAQLSGIQSAEKRYRERALIITSVGITIDGCIYDKYTGYLLQQGVFEYQEQFTEDGRLDRGNEVITDETLQENVQAEKLLNVDSADYVNQNILESAGLATVVDAIDALQFRKETTSYEMSDMVKNAVLMATKLKIIPTYIQSTVVRLTNQFKSAIMSKEKYTQKAKEGSPSYATYEATLQIIIAVNVLLVAIHTTIPTIYTTPPIPMIAPDAAPDKIESGWKKGAAAILRIVDNLAKNQLEPWAALNDANTKTLNKKQFEKSCFKFFQTNVFSAASVVSLYANKAEYETQKSIQQRAHSDSYSWPGFLPHLGPITDLGPSPVYDDKKQRDKGDKYTRILAASYWNAMNIMKQINDQVNAEPLVMRTLANVPYLENGCCNALDMPIFPLDYFIKRANLTIRQDTRELVKEVHQDHLLLKQMPAFFSPFDPASKKQITNTRDVAMEMELFHRDTMNDRAKYDFLIYYLNLNETRGYIGIPPNYVHVLSEVPDTWNSSFSAATQRDAFLNMPLQLSVSIDEFVKQVWMTEIATSPLRFSPSVSELQMLYYWTRASAFVPKEPLTVTAMALVHQSHLLKIEEMQSRLSEKYVEWFNSEKEKDGKGEKDSDEKNNDEKKEQQSLAYSFYSYRGLEGDSFIEYIDPQVQEMKQRMYFLANDKGRTFLTMLDQRIKALYDSPLGFRELLQFMHNMVWMDSVNALTYRHPEGNNPGFKNQNMDAFSKQTFIYSTRPYLTPSMMKLYTQIMDLRMFSPWIKFVQSLIVYTPIADSNEGEGKGDEEDKYRYKGFPPYIVARLYQYAWLNIWMIWMDTINAIPADFTEELQGKFMVADERDWLTEDDMYSKDRLQELGKQMIQIHLTYHGSSMAEILVSEEALLQQIHNTKQSEKEQIMNQYKTMSQTSRNLQRTMIMAGLARYQLDGPVNGDSAGADLSTGMDDNVHVQQYEGYEENNGANQNGDDEYGDYNGGMEGGRGGEGVDMMNDGNYDDDE